MSGSSRKTVTLTERVWTYVLEWAATIGLHHENPGEFGEPQWGGLSLLYVLFRICVAIYSFRVWFDASPTKGFAGHAINCGWLYRINLNLYLALVLSLVLQAITAVHHFLVSLSPNSESEYVGETSSAKLAQSTFSSGYMPMLYKLTWVARNVSISAILIITVTNYWVSYNGWQFNEKEVEVHVRGLFWILLDLVISGIPVHVLHIYHGVVAVIMYYTISVALWSGSYCSIKDNHRAQNGVKLNSITKVVLITAPVAYIGIWLLQLIGIIIGKILKTLVYYCPSFRYILWTVFMLIVIFFVFELKIYYTFFVSWVPKWENVTHQVHS